MALAPTSRLHWAGTYDQAFDYAAGTVVRQGGGLYRARVLRPHGAAAPADDAASWDTLASTPAGVPVLYGPYVVDFSDFGPSPMEGHTVDLWVPAVGDVLLRLFIDWQNLTQFDHGTLWVFHHSSADPSDSDVVLAQAVAGSIGLSSGTLTDDTGTLDFPHDLTQDKDGNIIYSGAYVFHRSDPIYVQLAQTGGTDPGAGHVELYALVARAVAP